jgi:hypothetical protein
MAFAPSGHAQQVPEGIQGHFTDLPRCARNSALPASDPPAT